MAEYRIEDIDVLDMKSIVINDLQEWERENIIVDGLINIPLVKGEKGDKGDKRR